MFYKTLQITCILTDIRTKQSFKAHYTKNVIQANRQKLINLVAIG